MTDAERLRCECGEPKESWAHCCYGCGQQERREQLAYEREEEHQQDEEDEND